uniref:SAP domain protein n=1 Tax=Iridovirus LCIVAC01 TaxID=2506607 RepID=A0A481YQ39_9VIRU|nr:MAG: SAP domain protein [Iridovirus LCIVAC01]
MNQHLGEKINDLLESAINNYCKEIAKQYDLNCQELLNIWHGTCPNQKEVVKGDETLFNPTPEQLVTYNKAQLVALCKDRNLKVSGKKSDLINRLAGNGNEEQKPIAKKKSKKKTSDSEQSEVIKKLNEKREPIQIIRNDFGNYEHLDTKLVFDRESQLVIGVQKADGTIGPLTESDIENCDKYKFNYRLPDNLNIGSSLKNIRVEEIDDDDEEDEELDDKDIEEVEEEYDGEDIW